MALGTPHHHGEFLKTRTPIRMFYPPATIAALLQPLSTLREALASPIAGRKTSKIIPSLNLRSAGVAAPRNACGGQPTGTIFCILVGTFTFWQPCAKSRCAAAVILIDQARNRGCIPTSQNAEIRPPPFVCMVIASAKNAKNQCAAATSSAHHLRSSRGDRGAEMQKIVPAMEPEYVAKSDFYMLLRRVSRSVFPHPFSRRF